MRLTLWTGSLVCFLACGACSQGEESPPGGEGSGGTETNQPSGPGGSGGDTSASGGSGDGEGSGGTTASGGSGGAGSGGTTNSGGAGGGFVLRDDCSAPVEVSEPVAGAQPARPVVTADGDQLLLAYMDMTSGPSAQQYRARWYDSMTRLALSPGERLETIEILYKRVE